MTKKRPSVGQSTSYERKRGRGGPAFDIALDPQDLNRIVNVAPSPARKAAYRGRGGRLRIAAPLAARKREASEDPEGCRAKKRREQQPNRPKELPPHIQGRLGSDDCARRLIQQADATFFQRSTPEQKAVFPSSPPVSRLVRSTKAWRRLTGLAIATVRKILDAFVS